LPPIELISGFALILSSGPLLTGVMLWTIFLLSVFTVWVINVYARKLQIACGCFGKSHSLVNRWTVLRNVILLTVAIGEYSYIIQSMQHT
jgi:hypothetical protein